MQGVALISNGKAWSRSESQRQSGVENGNALKRADLQWSSSEQISMDLQWHGIDMTGNGEKNKRKGIEMKALIEIVLMWSAALAVVLAAFLLNLWLVHHIELLVGISGAWYIVIVAAVMATVWILSFGGDKNEKPEG